MNETQPPQPKLTELQQKLLDVAKHGAEQGAKADGEILPILLYDEGGKLVMAAFPCPDKAMNSQMGMIARIKAETCGGAVLVQEAWVSWAPLREESPVRDAMKRGEGTLLPPRLDPQHRDACIIKLYLPGKRVLIYSADLTKLGEGKGGSLGAWRGPGDSANGTACECTFEPDAPNNGGEFIAPLSDLPPRA